MILILNLLLISAWGFMLITKGLFYTLSFGLYLYVCGKLYKPIKSYLPMARKDAGEAIIELLNLQESQKNQKPI